MSWQVLVFCGFASAFDRLAKASTFDFNAYSSNCISEVSCSLSSWSLLFKFVTKLFKPWEMTHEWELSLFIDSILISTPNLLCRQQVATSNTGPILVFPRIQPFGSDDFSSLGKVYSWHVTDSVICENYSSVSFVMKYCPTSTVVRNHASIQNLLSLSCCENFSIRSQNLRNRSSSCAQSSVKGMFVFITFGTNDGLDCPSTTSLDVLSWQESHSSHISLTAP